MTTTAVSTIVPTDRCSWEQVMGYEPSSYGSFSDLAISESTRISDGIWNTIVKRYHQVVADDVFASLLIYQTIFHQVLIRQGEVL